MTERSSGWRLVGLGAIASTTACEALIGAEFDDAKPKATSPTPACDLARAPSPPSIVGAGDEIEFVSVVRSVDYGERRDQDTGIPEYRDIGLDVDGVCTGPDEPRPCRAPDWLTTDLTDGSRGQDNAIGHVLLAQEDVLGVKVITSGLLDERVAEGVDAPAGLIRISDYGGFSEDDRVQVDWFVPVPPSLGPAGSFVPAFDGTDEFPVAASELGPSDGMTLRAAARDANAYVTQRTLVAKLDRVLIPMANVYFEVVDVVVTGDLVRDAGTEQWTIEHGVVSGKARERTLIDVVPAIGFSISAVALCPTDPNFFGVKEVICAGADILFDGSSDPAAVCDGMSVGIAFETAPARVGEPAELPDPAQPCPTTVSPSERTCSAPPPKS